MIWFKIIHSLPITTESVGNVHTGKERWMSTRSNIYMNTEGKMTKCEENSPDLVSKGQLR